MTTEHLIAFLAGLRRLGTLEYEGPVGEFAVRDPERGRDYTVDNLVIKVKLAPFTPPVAYVAAPDAQSVPAVPNEVADLRKAAGLSDAAIADLHETLSG